jgi:hypothetical protein
MPRLTALRVYDSSADAYPVTGKTPKAQTGTPREARKDMQPARSQAHAGIGETIVATALKLR